MDALMAALVAAAAAQVGDRPAWLAAILADRWRRPGLVIAMAALALMVASGLAAAAGALLAPMLAPNAKLLLLALALLLQGGGALFAATMPDRLDGWRVGAAATTFLGVLILAFGDGVQFIVAALAARTPVSPLAAVGPVSALAAVGPVPALAAVGATLGSLAVIAPAALMGEAAWRRLPLRGMRIAIGIGFVGVAAVTGLSALGLT